MVGNLILMYYHRVEYKIYGYYWTLINVDFSFWIVVDPVEYQIDEQYADLLFSLKMGADGLTVGAL